MLCIEGERMCQKEGKICAKSQCNKRHILYIKQNKQNKQTKKVKRTIDSKVENNKGKFAAVKRHQNMHNIVKFGLILKVKGTQSFKSWSDMISTIEHVEHISGGGCKREGIWN